MDPRRQRMVWICVGIGAAIVVFVAAIVVGLLIVRFTCKCKHTTITSTSTTSCPDGWVGYHGVCYYFSKEEYNFTYSEEFCDAHGATLVTIEKNEVKDFVARSKCSSFYWFGLKKQGQSWNWLNGEHAKVDIIGTEGDCAVLDGFNDISITSTNCSNSHHWICFKHGLS